MYEAPHSAAAQQLSKYLGPTVFAAALLWYANAMAWLSEREAGRARPGQQGDRVPPRVGSILPHLAMLGFSLAWAKAARLTPIQLGLGPVSPAASLIWGLVVGILGSALIRSFFGILDVAGRPVRLAEFQELGLRGLGALLAQFFLGSALFEEVAFRGVLHAQLVRLMGTQRAVGAGSVVFAAWHTLITLYNLRRSGLPGSLFPVLYGGAMGALVVAGLLFGALREMTGHLAGAVLAHWLLVVSIVLSVRGRGTRGGRGGRRDEA